MSCEGCGDKGHDKCLVPKAIDDAACEYCGAKAGDTCTTVEGKKPGTETPHHIIRVHAAHVALVDAGTPCRASRLLAKRPCKGRTRHYPEGRP